ncbi:MAG: L,D-transpeptidase [Hyphomicrobiales bacterium]|nr:L,D-transpeptidase [Hyphomicrobiales bacterium]
MRSSLRSLAIAVGAAAVIGTAGTPAAAREEVRFTGSYPIGSIVIKNQERRLYFVAGHGRAIRYPVAVGKSGKRWVGRTYVDGKYVNPAWAPPAIVKRDIPSLPDLIPGGAPNNPMGKRALTLAGDEYAIHGTNRPKSVGRFASYGCIRMYNSDIIDLFDRVRVGTPVIVVP